jgi:hypothetical protein
MVLSKNSPVNVPSGGARIGHPRYGVINSFLFTEKGIFIHNAFHMNALFAEHADRQLAVQATGKKGKCFVLFGHELNLFARRSRGLTQMKLKGAHESELGKGRKV